MVGYRWWLLYFSEEGVWRILLLDSFLLVAQVGDRTYIILIGRKVYGFFGLLFAGHWAVYLSD